MTLETLLNLGRLYNATHETPGGPYPIIDGFVAWLHETQSDPALLAQRTAEAREMWSDDAVMARQEAGR